MPNKQTLKITQNAPLSLEALEKPIAMTETVGMFWCPIVRYGGFYYVDTAMWHTFGPFDDYLAFKRYLVNHFPEVLIEKD